MLPLLTLPRALNFAIVRAVRIIKLSAARVAATVFLAQLLVTSPASAAHKRTSSKMPARAIKIAVLAKESRAQNTVSKALKANHRVQLASNEELARARIAFRRNALSEKDYVALSEEHGIAAFAVANVTGRKQLTLTVAIRNGDDGSVLAEAEWSKLSPSRLKAVQQTFWKTLGPHIRKAKAHQPTPAPAAETPPPPLPSEPPAAKSPEPSPPSVAALSPAPLADSHSLAASPSPTTPAAAESPAPTTEVARVSASDGVDPQSLTLDAALGAGAFSRDFSYSADATALGSYHLTVGPMVSGTLQFYPLAMLTSGFPSWFGLVGGGDYAVGVKSATANGPSLKTSAYRYSGGLRFRFPIGNSEVGLSASYGSTNFSIQGQNPPIGTTAIPDVSYRFVLPELSARIGILRTLWVLAGASYMQSLGGSGQISSTAFFPHATAKGLSGSLGFAWELASSMELRFIAEYDRVSLSMNSQAQDPLRAQGAVDQYILGRGTFAYRWK